jgi:hypothetical protein
VLHTSTREALDLAEVYTFVLQTLQDKVDSFKPHCCRREDFAFARVGEYTFGDAIFRAEVGVEVDFGLVLVL